MAELYPRGMWECWLLCELAIGTSREGITDHASSNNEPESPSDQIMQRYFEGLGAMGGFCASRHDVLSLFRYISRPFMFTASPSPAVMATTREALRQLRTRPELREMLWANAHRLYNGLQELGFELGPEISPVVAVLCKDRQSALANWNKLLEAGVYVNMMLPPATPAGASFLRCSISAAHTPDQITTIIKKFKDL